MADHYQKDTQLVWRLWFYFRRGHGSYLSFFVSLVTFVVVAYQLSISNVPVLKSIFPNMWIFAVAFAALYGVITVLIGWQDMKKGSYQTETKMTFDMHPRVRAQYDAIVRIEQRLEKLEKLLEKR